MSLSQLKPFFEIAIPFFKENNNARNSLISIGALTLLNSGVSVAFSYISRDFYNALNLRDEALFYEKIELFFAALIVAIPVTVLYRFTREKLSIVWREALTTRVLEKYYSNRTFYVIETLKNIDNPDQRIAEDIRHFTRTSLDFLITLLTAVIDLASFSAILYQIFPGLFLAIIAYAGVGSFITSTLGQALVSQNFNKLQREADFRFALVRNRENAEAIAFYDSDATIEREHLQSLLGEALSAQLGIVITQRNLETFTTAYRYLVQILPSLIVAPLYFRHQIELGSISQSYGAFNHILGDFSLIINQFEAISAFSAGLTRLNSFLSAITIGGWNQSSSVSAAHGAMLNSSALSFIKTEQILSSSSEIIAKCANLTVLTPDASRCLVGNIPVSGLLAQQARGIDFTLKSGDKVLIVGASGAGKSTFIRALAGLWQIGYGSVQWLCSDVAHETGRPPSDVFFMPQKPYNLLGSLREQIMYPSNSSSAGMNQMSDEALLSILNSVRLPNVARLAGDGNMHRGLGVVKDWSKILSLGEQQRLAFARVLFNAPKVVIMDESTSALDLYTEEAMYALLNTMGVTYVSVGHRPSLLRYHDSKLVLKGPGNDVELSRIEVAEREEQTIFDLTSSGG